MDFDSQSTNLFSYRTIRSDSGCTARSHSRSRLVYHTFAFCFDFILILHSRFICTIGDESGTEAVDVRSNVCWCDSVAVCVESRSHWVVDMYAFRMRCLYNPYSPSKMTCCQTFTIFCASIFAFLPHSYLCIPISGLAGQAYHV